MNQTISTYRFGEVLFGSVVYPPGGSHRQIQSLYQIVCIHSGNVNLRINGTNRFIDARSIMLLVPGREYHFRFSTETPTWHTWINFFNLQLSPGQQRFVYTLPYRIPLSSKMDSLLNTFMTFEKDRQEGDKVLLRDLASMTLQLFIHEAGAYDREGLIIHPAVKKACLYMADNLQHDLHLKQIAEAAGLSAEYLVRLFKKAGYMPPMEYLWERRLERSLDLLRSTGLTAGEIADQTGFKNQYHFSRKIKRKTGAPPAEYRRHHRLQKIT